MDINPFDCRELVPWRRSLTDDAKCRVPSFIGGRLVVCCEPACKFAPNSRDADSRRTALRARATTHVPIAKDPRVLVSIREDPS